MFPVTVCRGNTGNGHACDSKDRHASQLWRLAVDPWEFCTTIHACWGRKVLLVNY